MIRFCIVLFAMVAFLLPSPSPACSLCGGSLNQQKTIRQDWEKAKLVLVGTAANPRFNADGNGTGATDFNIEKRLKDDPFLGKTKVIMLNRYIPVVDPKNPPRFVVFCDIFQGKLDPFTGRSVRSPALLDYLKGIEALKGKEKAEFLQFLFRYLDHEDETLANDAFIEFVRSSDADIGKAAKALAPEKLRVLVQNPKVSPERLSLYAFLLGICGKEQDALLLRSMIDRPTERTTTALDGILGGYINLKPREGWELARKILADKKLPFPPRYAAVRTLRFYHGWKPAESKTEILRGFDSLIEDGEMADLAVEDLRQWQTWDLTGKVLAQYGKPSHNAPIIRRTIIRYALCCPLPAARQFVETVRRQDPNTVRDLEEGLKGI
jgi:hypothetical protein